LATNSIKSPKEQIKRLNKIGLTINISQIYSPINSINIYIDKNRFNSIMVIGSSDEANQIKGNITNSNPDLIILLDFEKSNITYSKLQTILDYVENGSHIVTASRSSFYLKNGKKQIDTGAYVALIESITNKTIPVLGKPSKEYFENAMSLLCGNHHEIVTVIGDDWQTDIIGAKSVGFNSILVKSGKYIDGDEKKSNPDLLIDNLFQITV